MSFFQVGQKVARISGESERATPCPPIGEVVTVCNVYLATCDCGCGKPETMIELTEYPAPAEGCFLAGWVARHFRPVVESKTDISVFTRLQTPARPKQLIDA